MLADLGFFPFRSSSSFASSSIAFNPRGVAPQPSPKKFAMTLAEIYSIAGCSFGILGNKKCKSGCIFSVILSINPELLAICMIPIHIATIPDIAIQSATASLAQDNAASVTSASLPVTAPYRIYVHAQPQPGAGGLPVGINGRAVSLLSGGIDSPVASWMIAKRGVALEMVHFFSYPYTSPEAKEKVLELARLLTPYTGRLTVHVVPFTAIQEELRRSCPEELFTIIMRRFMMRISQAVAKRCGAKALVTGECLGQVASQTMDAMLVTGSVVELPILRPCIGMDKEEIVQIARRIGTFETSILPYEDCCTVFTPRHPRLRPMPGEVEAAEQALDIEAMVQAAVDGIERVQVNL